jgi:hypothetical protein
VTAQRRARPGCNPLDVPGPLIEVTIRAPVDDVWDHLRDPLLIRRWFGWEYDGLSEEIDGIFGEWAEADEDARSLRWEEGGDRFELEPEGDNTRLRVTRSASGSYDDIGEGWISFVQQLRFALDRHAGEDRRTLYLSSPAAASQTLPVAETLGLDAAARAPVGARYDATAGPGDSIAGEIWFRTEHQLGLTVDQLGDGLLLVTEKPAAAKPPHGAASLTLSVYGPVAAARLDDRRARWNAWWEEHVGRAAALT